MRVLVCGTRAPKFVGEDKKAANKYYTRVHQTLFDVLDVYMLNNFNAFPDEVVEGEAPTGGDRAGRNYADYYNIPIAPFPADWVAFGKRAGRKRNAEMAEYCDPEDSVVALWDMKSPGTLNMLEIAKQRGMKVHVINCSAEFKLFEQWADPTKEK